MQVNKEKWFKVGGGKLPEVLLHTAPHESKQCICVYWTMMLSFAQNRHLGKTLCHLKPPGTAQERCRGVLGKKKETAYLQNFKPN